MTNHEIKNKIEEMIEKYNMLDEMEADYIYYGIRFEDMDRDIGDICGNSRHHPNREDERDFPEFGSDDYNEMEELDGASAWKIAQNGLWINSFMSRWQKDDSELAVMAEHCYIIAGDIDNTHDDADDNEIVIEDAIVIGKIF